MESKPEPRFNPAVIHDWINTGGLLALGSWCIGAAIGKL